jgi:hypothetical protein
MADVPPPAGAGGSTDSPPAGAGDDTAPSDDARGVLKGIVAECLDEWFEKNKPSPKRTEKKTNVLDQILGFGK